MDTVRFFGWLIGSVCVSGITIVGVFLRLYLHDALQAHGSAIERIVADNYVRKDVHEARCAELRALIEG